MGAGSAGLTDGVGVTIGVTAGATTGLGAAAAACWDAAAAFPATTTDGEAIGASAAGANRLCSAWLNASKLSVRAVASGAAGVAEATGA